MLAIHLKFIMNKRHVGFETKPVVRQHPFKQDMIDACLLNVSKKIIFYGYRLLLQTN